MDALMYEGGEVSVTAKYAIIVSECFYLIKKNDNFLLRAKTPNVKCVL